MWEKIITTAKKHKGVNHLNNVTSTIAQTASSTSVPCRAAMDDAPAPLLLEVFPGGVPLVEA